MSSVEPAEFVLDLGDSPNIGNKKGIPARKTFTEMPDIE
jgi:hypothetical protein